jgi:hypothetical protein
MVKKKSNPIQVLLSTPGKGKLEPGGIRGFFAAFYRSILDDINMNPMWWDSLMRDWISDYRQGAGEEPRKKITSMRGNLMKELGKPEMTWKVFSKGVRFLQPIKVDVSLRITWRSKKVTEHTQTLNFGARNELAALLEDLKEDENDNEHGEDNDKEHEE